MKQPSQLCCTECKLFLKVIFKIFTHWLYHGISWNQNYAWEVCNISDIIQYILNRYYLSNCRTEKNNVWEQNMAIKKYTKISPKLVTVHDFIDHASVLFALQLSKVKTNFLPLCFKSQKSVSNETIHKKFNAPNSMCKRQKGASTTQKVG